MFLSGFGRVMVCVSRVPLEYYEACIYGVSSLGTIVQILAYMSYILNSKYPH